MAKAGGKTKTKAAAQTVRGIKGFDAKLQCRGFQFEVDKTFTHDGPVKCCSGGFHAITAHPLAVFDYYPPAGSRFCLVELGGALHSDDQIKTAAAILNVGREIGISDLVNEAVKWVVERTTPEGSEHATGDRSAASATGYRSAASATGYRSAASATGYRSAASATGYRSAASATGDRSAASATGDLSAASATGDRSAASATGYQSAAMACGYGGMVNGIIGCALFAVERDANWNIVSVACGIVGQNGIEPNKQYRCLGGKLVEA